MARRKIQNKILWFYYASFSLPFAIASAIWNGGWILWFNSDYGTAEWLRAAGGQALMSFLLTGVTARIVQHFSRIESKLWSYSLGSVIPATFTFVVTLAIHWLLGTPAFWSSVLEPAAVSFGTNFVTNWMTRVGFVMPKKYPET